MGMTLWKCAPAPAVSQFDRFSSSAEYTFTCKLNSDCYTSWPGYICQNSRCVCDPEKEIGLFSPCLPGLLPKNKTLNYLLPDESRTFVTVQSAHGNHCRVDSDCKDFNLMCAKMDKTCKCRRYLLDHFFYEKFLKKIKIPEVLCGTCFQKGVTN
jgi:hypothetical protein